MKSTNRGLVYLYHELIGEAAFLFGFQLLRDLFDLNFVINGNVIVISLHKEIKYVNRN